ncbi:MAG: hypothetical protein J6K18_01550 [Bacilli bacterium]|nr:hypothetical protein [Bacilli bacterium]
MKKFVFIFLCLISLFGLTACNASYEEKKFFSEEVLSQAKLNDIPVPANIENSVIQYGNKLYLKLTDDEYVQYVASVLNYLKTKEDIYYLGYSVGSGLVAEMFPYNEIAPLTENYKETLDNHHFFFSKENGIDDKHFLSAPVEIDIKRVNAELTYKKFQYNTQIIINEGHSAQAQWNICGAIHTFDEGKEYKIPGSNNTVTEYTCIHCGSTEMSDFIGDMKMYNIIIEDTNADHYIIKKSDSVPSGVIVSIVTQKLIDADIKFIVNGTEIKPNETEDDKWSYDFIMPCCDVVITTELITGSPNLE